MKHFLFAILVLLANFIFGQSIYEIQGQADASPYVGETVSTKGIVTAVFTGSYFIQDGDSAWTGLYVFDEINTPSLGDSLELSGDIEEYYNLTELKNVSDYTVVSSSNPTPKPIVIPTGEATEKWESVLIKFEGATCTNTDLGYGEWEVNDGSGTIAIDDLGIVYSPMQDALYNVTGALNYSFDAFKVEPRDENDIVIGLPVYFTKEPVANEIMTKSLNLDLETNVESSISMQYGITTEFELGTIYSSASSTTHSIKLTNLEPATVYYTQTIGKNIDKEQTPTHNGIFITQSESSGEMHVYFNHPEMASVTKSSYTENIVDTIISYLEKAESSLDITMYDLTNHASTADSTNYRLIQAVNQAYEKGIQVRFITDDEPSNTALDSLNSNIQVLKGNFDGIMHNKFLIIDANTSDNAWVITGSTNWTYNNLMMDFNNLVCIQDQSLAKAYELEFNEMWGLSGPIPHLEETKFGKYKTDNTPHQFNINGTYAELYFSPSDKTTSKIVKAIDQAENSVDFTMMVFTENQLGNAVVNAQKRGLSTKGIIDYIEYSGSEYDRLKENNVGVYDFNDDLGWPDGKTVHHKFCVIDAFGNTPIAITGTHNWSASAESKNDENTLLIYDSEIAYKFYEEQQQILMYMGIGGGSVSDQENSLINVYPNPSKGVINIQIDNQKEMNTVNIYTVSGKKIISQSIDNYSTIEIPNSGLYFIEVINDSYRAIQKVIIE